MLPSLNDILYFQEVSKSENITRAAERLGVTQPSLSLALNRLEEIVGTELLIRSRKGVQLTRAGREFLKESIELVVKWQNLKNKTVDITKEVKGEITIGCHPSVALFSLPGVLPELLASYQELDIKLVHNHSAKIIEDVINFKVDMGIVINPVEHPDLIIKNLGNDTVQLWRGPKKNSNNDPSSGQAVLICDEQLLQTQSLLKKLKKNGISYSRVIKSNNLELITKLTIEGAGIGIIPTSVGKVFGPKKLFALPKSPKFQDKRALIYRYENKGIAAVELLSKKIHQALSS